jgi:ABC-type transport system involved in cytochrome c biogenesis permease component
LLLVGSAVSVAIGVWGVVWTDMLDRALGLGTELGEPAFSGLARLFGGVMLVVGVGYALAAAQPQRNRGLLVPLFLVPFVTGVMTIAGAARQEISGGKGAVFAAYNFGFCLLYFRLYPRLTGAADELPRDERSDGSART